MTLEIFFLKIDIILDIYNLLYPSVPIFFWLISQKFFIFTPIYIYIQFAIFLVNLNTFLLKSSHIFSQIIPSFWIGPLKYLTLKYEGRIIISKNIPAFSIHHFKSLILNPPCWISKLQRIVNSSTAKFSKHGKEIAISHTRINLEEKKE